MAIRSSSHIRQEVRDTWSTYLRIENSTSLNSVFQALISKSGRSAFESLTIKIENSNAGYTAREMARYIFEAIRASYFEFENYRTDKAKPTERIKDIEAVIKKINSIKKDITKLHLDESIFFFKAQPLDYLDFYITHLTGAKTAIKKAKRSANTLNGILARNLHVAMMEIFLKPEYALIAQIINTFPENANNPRKLTGKDAKDLKGS